MTVKAMAIDRQLERVFAAVTDCAGTILGFGFTLHHLPDGRWRFKNWIGECVLPADMPSAPVRIWASLDLLHDTPDSMAEYFVECVRCICTAIQARLQHVEGVR